MPYSEHDLNIVQRLTQVEQGLDRVGEEIKSMTVNVNRLINAGSKDRRFWRWAVGSIVAALAGGAIAFPKASVVSADDIAHAITSTQTQERREGIVGPAADRDLIEAWKRFLENERKNK